MINHFRYNPSPTKEQVEVLRKFLKRSQVVDVDEAVSSVAVLEHIEGEETGVTCVYLGVRHPGEQDKYDIIYEGDGEVFAPLHLYGRTEESIKPDDDQRKIDSVLIPDRLRDFSPSNISALCSVYLNSTRRRYDQSEITELVSLAKRK